MPNHHNRVDVAAGSAARRDVGPSPATPAATSSTNPWWRRGGIALTGAAATVAVFSSGVLYADLSSDRATGLAVTQAPPAATASPSPTSPTPTSSPTPTVRAPVDLPVVNEPVGAVRGAPPVQISIPDLKIDQRLVGLRVKADRQLEVPQSYDDIGWWNTGPTAGDPGAALMVGHVDSKKGPAVFYGLSALQKGADISVRRADGTTVKFAVTKVEVFSKENFPDQEVYRTEGKVSLHLLTCGGTYDASTGYRDNVVVFADLVKPEAKASRKPASKETTR